jgi:hypothetical protein
MEQTEHSQKEILDLIAVAQKDRDVQWEMNFLKIFPHSKVTLMAQAPQGGPDQFPYMFIEIKEDSAEPALDVLKWISQNGVGLAVNPTKNYPDFVLTYGMIWNYFRSGQFLENPVAREHVHGPNCNHRHDDAKDSAPQNESVELYVGSPSEGYLPPPVRAVLKEFLKQQGVMAPKITMVSKDKVNFDLCFSIESFGSPKAEEHEGILQGLSWFLPAHYSLAFVSELGLPSFEEL